MLFLMAERRRLWLALEAVGLQFAFPRAFASELSEPRLKCCITASGYPSKHFRESLWFSEEELAELEGTSLYRVPMIQIRRMCTLVLLDFYLGILGGS